MARDLVLMTKNTGYEGLVYTPWQLGFGSSGTWWQSAIHHWRMIGWNGNVAWRCWNSGYHIVTGVFWDLSQLLAWGWPGWGLTQLSHLSYLSQILLEWWLDGWLLDVPMIAWPLILVRGCLCKLLANGIKVKRRLCKGAVMTRDMNGCNVPAGFRRSTVFHEPGENTLMLRTWFTRTFTW